MLDECSRVSLGSHSPVQCRAGRVRSVPRAWAKRGDVPGDAARTVALPHALEQLSGLARALASPTGLPTGLRAWVTVPTSRLAVAATTLGALTGSPKCVGCFHADLQVGHRAVAYVDRKFEDATVTQITETHIRIKSLIPRSTATAPRLPDVFPDRHAVRLTEQDRTQLARAYGCDPSLAGHEHVRASIHPVIVVGLPERTREDLESWLQIPGTDQHAVHRATTATVDDWYRAPVLPTGVMPSLARRSWLTQVRPRLVITTTTAAALAATPWPDVPVLSLLSRRSPSTVVAAELIQQMHATPVAPVADHLRAALTPGHGLEIHAAHLPADQPMPVSGADTQEEEEW